MAPQGSPRAAHRPHRNAGSRRAHRALVAARSFASSPPSPRAPVLLDVTVTGACALSASPAEVEFLHLCIGEQRLCGPIAYDHAVLDDVTVVRDLQNRARVLI